MTVHIPIEWSETKFLKTTSGMIPTYETIQNILFSDYETFLEL